MTKVISPQDAKFAGDALREVASRLDLRGSTALAASARRVADGLDAGGVIVASGSA
jgi:hypothetical protein